ncbi:MAG: hypothetical protein ACOC1G_02325 [Phycisphaeraceae bacterium]
MLLAMDIPPPPVWQSLLLEQPWPLAILLLVIGVILRTIGRRTQRRGITRVALVAVVLAAGVVALAYFVETGREAVHQRMMALVKAVEPLDSTAMRDLLSQDVQVTGPRGRVIVESGEVHRRLESSQQRYGVGSHRVRDLDVWAHGGEGRAMLALYSEINNTPALTRWGLWWEKQDGVWRIVEIRWLSYQGREPPVGALR